MTDQINIAKLRAIATDYTDYMPPEDRAVAAFNAILPLCDLVERQAAENARLRAALELAANRLLSCSITMSGHYKESIDADWWHREARAALNGGTDNDEG